MWVDAGRLKVLWVDVGRLKVVWGDAGRLKVVWGDAGRFNVVWVDAGRLKVVWGDAGRLKVVGYGVLLRGIGYTTIKRVTAATADYPLYLIVRRRCWPADSDAGRFRAMLAVLFF